MFEVTVCFPLINFDPQPNCTHIWQKTGGLKYITFLPLLQMSNRVEERDLVSVLTGRETS